MHSRVMITAKMSIPAVALCAVAVLACPESPPPAPLPPLPAQVSTIPIIYKQDLVIGRTENSLFVLEFTPSDKLDGVVTYRYRQLVRGDGRERTGNGVLFENYVSVPTGKRTSTVISDLGQLQIRVGDLLVEWSVDYENAGYLYFDPLRLTLQTKRGERFRGFNLAEEADW